MSPTAGEEFQIETSLIEQFHRDGYVKVQGLLKPHEIERYRAWYDAFLLGEIETGASRFDLGNHKGGENSVENITQIMWPSDRLTELRESVYYQRARSVARQLLANDEVDFDFDMWIDKAPRTDTPTPWHCDMAYWMELPDKDAVSCWLAIDPATVDNGCMWFVPGSHREPVRPHKQAAEGSRALQCECSEAEGVAVPLEPGSCTFHHAGTLHYSRGNTTASHRRAMITNFRSIEMIEYERAHDFDHGRKTSAG